MTFIEAVLTIDRHPDLEMCPNELEQNGVYDICVYRKCGQQFIGKLRWPRNGQEAEIDQEVLNWIAYSVQ